MEHGGCQRNARLGVRPRRLPRFERRRSGHPPVEDILAGDISIEEITASSAVVRVTTSIPVVCAVAFGPTSDYGRLSTDPDMGGMAHEEHMAPLLGLEPNTTYHYRLQGSGPDGTLYVSENLTFTTAESGDDDMASGTNLATLSEGARILDVSSAFGGSTWQAENAIDGDPSTAWSSAGDGDQAFITVELAREATIGAVGFWTRTMGSSAQVASFRVVTDAGEELGPFNVDDATQMHIFEVAVQARTLRFEVVASSGGNTGAMEIGVFGTYRSAAP